MSIPQVQVSDVVLDSVFSTLSNQSTGFNPLFRQQAPVYGIAPDYAQFNFTDTSKNFVRGQVDPDQFEVTGEVGYPFGCLYILESANTNLTKFSTFSGMVRVIFDVYLSWGPIRGIPNFEKYCNCVESVVISSMNTWARQSSFMRPLAYNGSVQCRRGPATFAAENWRQKLGFSFLIEVDEFES